MKLPDVSWKHLILGSLGLAIVLVLAFSISRVAGVVLAALAAASATAALKRPGPVTPPPAVADPIGVEIRRQADVTFDDATRGIVEDRNEVVSGRNRGAVASRLRGMLKLKSKPPGAGT